VTHFWKWHPPGPPRRPSPSTSKITLLQRHYTLKFIMKKWLYFLYILPIISSTFYFPKNWKSLSDILTTTRRECHVLFEWLIKVKAHLSGFPRPKYWMDKYCRKLIQKRPNTGGPRYIREIGTPKKCSNIMNSHIKRSTITVN